VRLREAVETSLRAPVARPRPAARWRGGAVARCAVARWRGGAVARCAVARWRGGAVARCAVARWRGARKTAFQFASNCART